MKHFDLFLKYKKDLVSLKKEGIVKIDALFWSGKMSDHLKIMLNSKLYNISFQTEILRLILDEYNFSVANLTIKLEEK